MNTLSKLLFTLTAAAALSFAHPAKANLITNPGFETGDFTGWTESGGNVVGTDLGVPPHSGNFQAIFRTDSLSQSVATTPGASYTIDFWLANAIPSLSNSFSVSWGGVTLLSRTNQADFGYTEFTFTETTSTASTALQFQFVNSTFGMFGGWLLDDVSVTPAGVPDGGSTVSLLGCALLGLAALRRKLSLTENRMKAPTKLLFTLTAAAALSLTYPASVQAVPTTYQYTGNPFTNVIAPYTTSDFVTGMVTFSGPLAPNMALTSVTPTAFSFSDGVQTITNLTATSTLFEFATGPTGAITDWSVDVSIGLAFIGLNAITTGDSVDLGPTSGSALNSKPGTWVITGAAPDSGSTLSLMTLTLIVLGLVARRFQRQRPDRAKES